MQGFFNFSPKIEKVGSYYTVSGINVKAFEHDLSSNFGTSVIFSRLITRTSSRSFKIHQFFMIEFTWLIHHLTNQSNKRVVDRYYVGMHKYKQLYDEIKTQTWVESTFRTFPSHDVNKALKKFTITPYPDQRDFLDNYNGIREGFKLRGCLLDAAVGSGKTPTSLVWAEMISDGAIFVIVPKGLVDNPWKEEINKLYKNPPKVWSTLDGTDIMDHLDAKIFIIHKEQIRTGEWDLAIKTITKSGRNPAKVIVDESHNYNVHTSSQSKGLTSFCKNPFISDVLMMSGTPIKAQGKETFTLFNIIDPMFDEAVHSQFLKLYGRDNTYLNEMLAHRLGRIKYTISAITNMDSPPEPIIVKVKFPGAENFTLDAIRAEMAMFITDRVRFYASMADEYLEDWTSIVNAYRQAVVHDKVNIEKLRKYLEIVNKFRTKGFDNSTDGPLSKFANEFEREMEQTVGMTGEQRKYWRHIKSAVKYVNLKIRGEALGNVLGKARMEAVRLTIAHANLPKYINAVKKKTLVYTSYVDVVHEVVSYLETQGMIASPLYGENTNEINTIINEFTNRPEINPLVTTFNTLREGRQMTMANQILLMNSPFRSYELVQTIARIYRRGQDEECFVYLFDLDTGKEENITSRSIDIMQWSEELVNQLMGGGKIPGLKQLNQNPIAFGGFESGMVWDVPTLDKDLEVDLELTVKRAMPIFKRANILDIF
ncbi:putative DNA helicase [Aeromonas phage LAh10]|uniref:Putative DNA helicase n=1 Tax=Aeromonas phage LAh10 TaxID=2591025 RepID=A0A514A178_9CAUD|nr:putative DNA helicase [Aeromonas phage LAh10]QDH47027.1 putative DNA helicase [Aeromonas phage LAh10]